HRPGRDHGGTEPRLAPPARGRRAAPPTDRLRRRLLARRPARAARAAPAPPVGRRGRPGALRRPPWRPRGGGGPGRRVPVSPWPAVRDGRVVKGVNFVGLRDAGDPVELAARYDEEGADEIVFLDITASHEGRETVVELAERTAEKVFIPFTIGGGLRTE